MLVWSLTGGGISRANSDLTATPYVPQTTGTRSRTASGRSRRCGGGGGNASCAGTAGFGCGPASSASASASPCLRDIFGASRLRRGLRRNGLTTIAVAPASAGPPPPRTHISRAMVVSVRASISRHRHSVPSAGGSIPAHAASDEARLLKGMRGISRMRAKTPICLPKGYIFK